MANIVRTDPLEDLFRGFFVRPLDVGANWWDAPSVKLDVREAGDTYMIEAELPGMKKEDIHVQIDGSVVSITGERKQEREVKEGERLLRMERSYGKVSRSFDMGADLDDAHAVAKFHDGVLELKLPKKAGVKAKQLAIA
ncbi:Hsp20/alpha crystallin family protein [Uliginosibacterium flavum]|uniref:Hsp20/alpha crystallin family protein n=1 Tax=Uliginosibacterium flavum TaxID=1396831 RepID=A0ABV2TMQ0_9RHOO